MTGVHTEEAQTAHIGVGHDLEGQSGEGLIIAGMTVLFLIGLGVGALDGGHVIGSGHIVHDGIQQLLHALVAVGSTAGDGHHFVGDGRLTDGLADAVLGDLLALQIILHNGVIEHGDGVQHHTVDQLGHQDAAVHRIGQNFSLGNITSSGHFASLLLIE